MRRRDLLNAGLAATAVLATPRIARRPAKPALRADSDLAVLDPVVTFNRPTRNYAYLVTRSTASTQLAGPTADGRRPRVDDDGLT
jgi:hypothetical protein